MWFYSWKGMKVHTIRSYISNFNVIEVCWLSSTGLGTNFNIEEFPLARRMKSSPKPPSVQISHGYAVDKHMFNKVIYFIYKIHSNKSFLTVEKKIKHYKSCVYLPTKLAQRYAIYPSYFSQIIKPNWAHFKPLLILIKWDSV